MTEQGFDRRTFFKGAGAVAILLAGGGLWRAVDRGVFSTGKGPAFEPWKSWPGGDAAGHVGIIRAAILAANPHNSQPWLFRLMERRIELYADTNRKLGAIDPFLREMYVGLGCALENMLVAAEAAGLHFRLAVMPTPEDLTHVATIDFAGDTEAAWPLHANEPEYHQAIVKRHTNRGPYDRERPLAQQTLDNLAAAAADFSDIKVVWFSDPDARRRAGEAIVRATQAIIADREQSQDSAKWIRWSWREVQQQRDGITIDSLGLPSAVRSFAKLLPRPSIASIDKQWLDSTRDTHVATAAAFGLLAVRNRFSRAQRIETGRVWQRMHLLGTTLGLGMQPLNQLPERADREESRGMEREFGPVLQELTGDSEFQTIMMFRAGYPTVEALPSPRRPITDVLL